MREGRRSISSLRVLTLPLTYYLIIMKTPTSLITVVVTVIIILACTKTTHAQYTTGISFINFNSSNGQISGTGVTAMDSYTASYYQAYVATYLIRQDTNQIVGSANAFSSPGNNLEARVAAVATTLGPNLSYRLESYHYLYPLSTYQCTFTRSDFFGYSWMTPGTYTGQNTWFAPFHSTSGAFPCVSGFIYLGETIQPFQTPGVTISITNPRVSGSLQNTTQTALLGADVTINANVSPNYGSGTYSWTFTGPNISNIGSSAATSVVRWTQPGTYTVIASYTINGTTTSSSMNANIVVPTVTNLSANQGSDEVFAPVPNNPCGVTPFHRYKLGCLSQDSTSKLAINFSATVQAPQILISDPSQSGVKFVQAVSPLRKRHLRGNFQCLTGRSTESDVSSGWMLDTSDPYDLQPTVRFSQGTTLTTSIVDSPGDLLKSYGYNDAVDAMYVDDRFETYLFYFTGSDPTNPILQRPLGKIVWNWGGMVVFNDAVATLYERRFSLATPTFHNGMLMAPNDPTVPYQGRNVTNFTYGVCPGGPQPTTSQVDWTRFFVQVMYERVLEREPDEGGQNDWVSLVAGCGFDTSCINSRRIGVARGFFESPEHIGEDPLLDDYGSDQFNREYVRLCYTTFLGRDPEEDGFNAWLDFINTHPGEYDSLVGGFINSTEFRNHYPVQ